MDPSEPSSSLTSHLPLLIGTLTTLFIAARILSAAEFDPETAYAILQAGGTAAVLVGVALQSLPVLPAPIFAIYLITSKNPFGNYKELKRQVLLSAQVVFIITAIFVAPIGGLIVVAVLGIFAFVPLWLIFRRRSSEIAAVIKRDDPQELEQTMGRHDEKLKNIEARSNQYRVFIAIWTAIVFTLLIAFNTAVWLPTERIVVRGHTMVGYVLSINAPYMAVLLTSPRKVVYVQAGNHLGSFNLFI
jgi:hypothetical protein